MSNIRAAIYTRVSTEDQANGGFSMQAQEDTAKEYISNKDDMVLVKVYSDPGLSGKSIQGRPGLNRLLEDTKKGLIDFVIVWKFSRMTRDVGDMVELTNLFAKYKVTLHSLSEGSVQDTATGRLQTNMMASLNQYERENIAENVSSGMLKRAKIGYYNTKAPLGYINNFDPKTGVKIITVEPLEAKIVQKIFTLSKQGNGYRAIANRLNHDGLQTKGGNSFSTDAVKTILNNKTYIGKIQWGKYKNYAKLGRNQGVSDDYIEVDGKHQPIITQELWNAAHKQMAKTSKKPQTYGGNQNVLTGILRCPQCGGSMAVSYQSRKLKSGEKVRVRQYSCAQFRTKGSAVCSANSIHADDIEDFVSTRILLLIKGTGFGEKVVKQLEISKTEKIKEFDQISNKIESQQKQLITKIEKYQTIAASDPDLKQAMLNQEAHLRESLNDLNSRMNEIQLQIQNLSNIPSSTTVDEVMEMTYDSLIKRKGDNTAIKAFYNSLISSVTFERHANRKKTVKIDLKVSDDLVDELKEADKKDELKGSPFFGGEFVFKLY
ncbi:recombinase family protein [Weissella koreensis]|uniref:Recombinase family protein n=1 Tax=Weissella koreensis TaxID=165096 RepID=A0A7H1MLT8_9LACO|nr:recombinase family protein [Weissella koreensis]AVH75220.1 hypothetical protein C4597_03895 [Weissella koreensis]QGN20445.1 hypothetical protein GKC51_03875 [Weissella koreensis]QNT64424.1 recombinase family protein [Weissella koreensis]